MRRQRSLPVPQLLVVAVLLAFGVAERSNGGPGGYGPGKLVLKSVAEVYSGATDTDSLVLRCDPAP